MIRDTARAFARERLAPFSAEWEESSTFPKAVFAEMGRLGLMGMTVPEEWGGAGTDSVAYALALEEIAAGDAAVATVMSGHNSVGCMPVLIYGTQGQKERWLHGMARGEILTAFALTEPDGGSDAGSLKTKAERRGGSYVLTGTKQYITTGKNADVCLVFARTAPGKRGITAFLVPTDARGYVVARVEKKMGQNASDTCQIVLDEVTVPADARLGEEGQGYRIALSNLEGGRIGIAAQAVGISQAALDAALDYAKQRIAFGKPIIEHQAVAFRLAEMATRIESARQLVLHAAAVRSAGENALTAASMAKWHASETAEKVCSDAVQIFGGYGYMRDSPVDRLYRAARVCRIYEGANDIQLMVIARQLAA